MQSCLFYLFNISQICLLSSISSVPYFKVLLTYMPAAGSLVVYSILSCSRSFITLLPIFLTSLSNHNTPQFKILGIKSKTYQSKLLQSNPSLPFSLTFSQFPPPTDCAFPYPLPLAGLPISLFFTWHNNFLEKDCSCSQNYLIDCPKSDLGYIDPVLISINSLILVWSSIHLYCMIIHISACAD